MRRRKDATAGWIAGLVMGLSQAWWWGNVYIALFVLLGGMAFSLTVWVALWKGGLMVERDWRDDPALAHLRDDAPYVVCSACGRKSWAGDQSGSRCGMPQPDGTSCEGVFGLPVDADVSPELHGKAQSDG